MLRLEKKRNLEINIVLQRPAQRFNRIFWQAFAIAFAFHFFALTLFYIHNYIFSENNQAPTAMVFTDLTPDEGVGGIQVVKDEVVQYHFFSPKHTEPHASNILDMVLEYPEATALQTNTKNPFDKAHEALIFAKNEKLFSQPLKIKVAGNLAEKQLIKSQMPDEKMIAIGKEDLASFDVRVDSTSGRIFWYAPKKLAMQQSHHVIAEKMLKQLIFEKSLEFEIIEGEVNFEFSTKMEQV